MFPHPEDAVDTLREQMQLMKELREKGVILLLSLTTPFPGTYYYDHADELGIKILTNNWDEYDAKHLIIETKYFSENKLKCLLKELVKYVGLGIGS